MKHWLEDKRGLCYLNVQSIFKTFYKDTLKNNFQFHTTVCSLDWLTLWCFSFTVSFIWCVPVCSVGVPFDLHLSSQLSLSSRRWMCGLWESPSTASSLGRQVCTFSVSHSFISICSTNDRREVSTRSTACYQQPEAHQWEQCLPPYWLWSIYWNEHNRLKIMLLYFVLSVWKVDDCIWFSNNLLYVLSLQCPFIDEYILALHNKIKTKPVDFPEKWAHLIHFFLKKMPVPFYPPFVHNWNIFFFDIFISFASHPQRLFFLSLSFLFFSLQIATTGIWKAFSTSTR